MLALFKRLAQISLFLVFMIVIAGSIVRTTGSGMGCPDWPKCFGRLIPPTNISQVSWAPEKEFSEGEMIVHEEQLWTAKTDMVAGISFEENNWEAYTLHDYHIYNPVHTWIEFCNRLLAPVSGIPVFFAWILSFLLWIKKKRFILFLCMTGAVFFMGFEAWLGKIVVEGNLVPGHISMHMIGTLFVLAFLIAAIIRAEKNPRQPINKAAWITLGVMLALLVQIVMGTQIRESVDGLIHAEVDRSLIVGELDIWFYVHRSFSILMVILTGWLVWVERKTGLSGYTKWVVILTLLEIVAGVILSYFSMPAWLQPVHLWLAVFMFMALFAGWIKLRYPSQGLG